MTGREIIKAIMEKVNVSNATLAHRLKIKPTAMWDRLNSNKIKDIPLATLDEMVRALDYKVLIVPSTTKCPKDGFEVESPRTEPRTIRKQEAREPQKSQNTKKEAFNDGANKTETGAATSTEPTEASPVNDEDVYVPTKEELEEYEKELQKLNEWRKSQGLPEIDLSKSSDEENATNTSEDYLDDELPW